jgi:hypothetical protein
MFDFGRSSFNSIGLYPNTVTVPGSVLGYKPNKNIERVGI